MNDPPLILVLLSLIIIGFAVWAGINFWNNR